MNTAAGHRRGERGIALVLVLWGTAIVALLAAAFAQSASIEARRLTNVVGTAEARALLDAGLAAAVVGLRDPDPGRQWVADGTAHWLVVAGARLGVQAFSEAGRIDVNHATPELLRNLLQGVAGDSAKGDELAAIILDRRGGTAGGTGSGALAQPGGGGRPFLSVVELSGLPGMTGDIFRQLADAVTVYNRRGQLDWRTAGPTALAALPGLSAPDVATLVASRRQSNYTLDPGLVMRLAAAGLPVGSGRGMVAGAGADGQVYTVRVTVETSRGARATAEAVVWLIQGAPVPYLTLEWREPAPRVEALL